MRPFRPIGALGAAVLMLFVLFVLGSESAGDLTCRRIALTDSVSGSPVQGAEDMALDPAGGRLILSAYDRRRDMPGGLYALPLGTLLDPATRRLTAQRLAPPPGAPPLRPHGFGLGALEGDGVPLAAILRKRRTGERKDAVLQAYVLGKGGLVPAGAPRSDPLLCNANDAVVEPGAILVTTDRGACGGLGRRIEDIFGLPRGRLLRVTRGGIQILAGGLFFANGIAEDERQLYVATTRDRTLLVYDRARMDKAPRRLRLDAAPDNLAWGDDGALYVAAHRSLLRFALYRLGLARDSASAIYRYDPAAGEGARPRLLGRTGGRGSVSGATVALAVRGWLLLGAGFDAGLSVCTREGTGLP